MFGSKKEKKVQDFIKQHYDKVNECLLEFKKTVSDYISGGKDYDDLSYTTHIKEHEADEIRRQIQVQINEGAFLPFYRSDFIELSEKLDKVAGKAKSVTQYISIEKPAIPQNIYSNLMNLCSAVLACYGALEGVITSVLDDKNAVFENSKKVSAHEQEVDSMQFHTLRLIFENSGLELAHKRQLKEMVLDIAEISDIIEDVADMCTLIVTKQSN